MSLILVICQVQSVTVRPFGCKAVLSDTLTVSFGLSVDAAVLLAKSLNHCLMVTSTSILSEHFHTSVVTFTCFKLLFIWMGWGGGGGHLKLQVVVVS